MRRLMRDKRWLLLSTVMLFASVMAMPAVAQSADDNSGAQATAQSADQYQDQNNSQYPDQAQDVASPSYARDEDTHDSHARVVRVSYVDGQVRIDHGSGYESATLNVPITEHNWIQTRSDGWVEIQLEDGSLVRLAPDTVIAFTELSRYSDGGTATTIDLDQGEAEFKVAKHDGSEFRVTVRNKVIALTQTGSFRITSTNSDPLELVVWKGEVAVRDSDSGGEVAVRKNETFLLDATDVGRYALEKGGEADSLDQFSKERDDYLSRYARNGNLQSPYQYGAGDLNNYGEYFDDPTYGTLWQPSGVNIGWDPFMNGYWSFVPGYGYTWVSAYPWGWLPFRYGRWIYVNHRGWCWEPGGWQRWHNGPRWVNAPPGFRPPTPPAHDRIVISGAPGGRVVRPGTPGDRGGAGSRSSGDRNFRPGRPGDRDGNPDSRGNRRVFTNDDVQARVPRTDVPAQPEKPGTIDADRKPKMVERQPEQNTGGGERSREDDRFHGDRQPPRVSRPPDAAPPAQRSQNSGGQPPEHMTAPVMQVPRQNTPPPPAPARSYSPPPEVHQAPPAPSRQQAPAQESHGRSDDAGSRSGRPK